MSFCVIVIHRNSLKVINVVKGECSVVDYMTLQIIHGITLSMYVRFKQNCFVKLKKKKREEGKGRETKQEKRRGGSNQPWPGLFWSKLQQSLQNKSTLEPTLLLLVIVSRIVSSRNRFRSFLQPASAPKKSLYPERVKSCPRPSVYL